MVVVNGYVVLRRSGCGCLRQTLWTVKGGGLLQLLTLGVLETAAEYLSGLVLEPLG